LAVKKITARLAGPKVQAAMAVDDVIGGITGERLTERVKRGFTTEKQKDIERRLKKKDRVIPLRLDF
jgi:Zn-dependent M16 (insulinase) family peptidase